MVRNRVKVYAHGSVAIQPESLWLDGKWRPDQEAGVFLDPGEVRRLLEMLGVKQS